MSGGSKSSGTQKVEQTVELPEWQEEHLKRIASEAGRTYDADFSGFAPYPGASYVPMGQDQLGAMDWTRSLLGNNAFLAPTFAGWGDIQSGSGMLGDQRDALSGAHASLGGYADVFGGTRGITGFGDLYSSLWDGVAGQSGFGNVYHGLLGGGVAGQDELGSVYNAVRDPDLWNNRSHNVRRDNVFGDLWDGVAGQSRLDDMYWGLNRDGVAGQQGFEDMYGALSKSGVAGQDELQQWLNEAPDQLASERYLRGIAGGRYLNGSNPYLDDIIGQSTARAQDATSSLFSGAGRYGGGAHQGVAAREAGEIATDFLGREYDLERQRQLQAAGQIDQATLGRRGQELAGIGQLSQTDLARQGLMRSLLGDSAQTDLARQGLMQSLLGDRAQIDLERHGLMRGLIGDEANAEFQRYGLLGDMAGQMSQTDLNRYNTMLSALGSWADTDLARHGLMGDALAGDLSRYDTMLSALQGGANTSLALGGQYGDARDAMMNNMKLAPLLREMQFSDPERLMRLGTLQQGELQAELQSMIDRWRAEQSMPLRELEYYQSIVNGLPSMAGQTETSSGTIPTGSPIAGALGGAMTGAGLAGQLGLLGGAAGLSNPLGWGLLGGGALMGLL